jgi:hypothetical protein
MQASYTVARESHLLHRGIVLEEVQVHKGDFLAARVLDHGLEARVVNLAQRDIEVRRLRLRWRSQDVIAKGKKRRGDGGETHAGGGTTGTEERLLE